MSIDFLPVVVSLISSYFAIKFLIPFANSIDLVDRPNYRKTHAGGVPLIGGVAIFLAILIGLLTTNIDLNQQKNLLLAMTMVVGIGVVDDHKDISVRTRIIMHIVAVLVFIIYGGVELKSLGFIFGLSEFKLHSWSLLFTIFAVIGVMNAINMIDGIDGLSGSLSLIALLFISYFSWISENTNYLIIASIIIPSVAVFLLFNLGIFGSTKKIFMGDAGTTLLGLIIAVLLIALSQGDTAAYSPVTALWLLSIPLIDTVSIMLRRVSKGQSPFKPDREHMHHFFIRSGISDRKALIIISILSFLMALAGSFMQFYGVAEWIMFVLFVLITLLYFFGTMHAWKVMKFIKN